MLKNVKVTVSNGTKKDAEGKVVKDEKGKAIPLESKEISYDLPESWDDAVSNVLALDGKDQCLNDLIRGRQIRKRAEAFGDERKKAQVTATKKATAVDAILSDPKTDEKTKAAIKAALSGLGIEI
jgi:hypothetical protein